VIVMMGAGHISSISHQLPARLAAAARAAWPDTGGKA